MSDHLNITNTGNTGTYTAITLGLKLRFSDGSIKPFKQEVKGFTVKRNENIFQALDRAAKVVGAEVIYPAATTRLTYLPDWNDLPESNYFPEEPAIFDEDETQKLMISGGRPTPTALLVNDSAFVAAFLSALADKIHADNVAAGWWSDIKTGQSTLHTRNVPEMLCLIHSEISEAMEGHRKKLMDDKLPHRPMLQVELVDAMIRILDLAGSRMAIEREDDAAFSSDVNLIGDIFEEKRAFNASRADHKIENRIKDGGKAF